MPGFSEYLQYEHSVNKALCRFSVSTSSSNQVAPSSLPSLLWLAGPSIQRAYTEMTGSGGAGRAGAEARPRLCGNGGSVCCSRRRPAALITHTYVIPLSRTRTNAYRCVHESKLHACTHSFTRTHTLLTAIGHALYLTSAVLSVWPEAVRAFLFIREL